MAIFLKIDSLTGNVTEQKHKDWIEVQSLSWGMSRDISQAVGASSDRGASKRAQIQDIVLSKPYDKCTNDLWYGCATAQLFKEAKFEFTQAGGGKGAEVSYLKITLKDVILSNYSLNASTEGKPTESVSLNFAKILTEYSSMDIGLKGGPSLKKEFNVETGG